jgi:hypothetical protein
MPDPSRLGNTASSVIAAMDRAGHRQSRFSRLFGLRLHPTQPEGASAAPVAPPPGTLECGRLGTAHGPRPVHRDSRGPAPTGVAGAAGRGRRDGDPAKRGVVSTASYATSPPQAKADETGLVPSEPEIDTYGVLQASQFRSVVTKTAATAPRRVIMRLLARITTGQSPTRGRWASQISPRIGSNGVTQPTAQPLPPRPEQACRRKIRHTNRPWPAHEPACAAASSLRALARMRRSSRARAHPAPEAR